MEHGSCIVDLPKLALYIATRILVWYSSRPPCFIDSPPYVHSGHIERNGIPTMLDGSNPFMGHSGAKLPVGDGREGSSNNS